MKNFNDLKETLRKKAELTPEQKKEIKGGYYLTKEECEEECYGEWTSGGGYYPYFSRLHCEKMGARWICMDS